MVAGVLVCDSVSVFECEAGWQSQRVSVFFENVCVCERVGVWKLEYVRQASLWGELWSVSQWHHQCPMGSWQAHCSSPASR